MPNTKNKETVKNISDKISKAKAIAFFEYKGLGSNALNELRKKEKEVSGEVVISKNTLIKIALGDKYPQKDDLSGQSGVVFSYSEDLIAPLKSLFDFSKKAVVLKIKGAYIDGEYYNGEKLSVVSSLPSKNELLSRALSGFMAPISGFATVLSRSNAKLVYALSELAKKKEVGE